MIFAWLAAALLIVLILPVRGLGTPLADSSQTNLTARAEDGRSVSAGGMDTIVVFNAKDSIHFSVSKRRMRLRGDAVVTFRTQKLESEVITMDFERSTMRAEGVRDSAGATTGIPLFTDAGENYAGGVIEYNFSTKRGRVEFGETDMDGAYYYGSKIKRVSESTIYVEDGCLTTCDAPHAHFYFKSPQMKAVMGDKVFMDPLVWYVEDIPVFALPIGLYFSLERGRRSGLIMPTPVVSGSRGLALLGVGYYVAISDYVDSKLTADLFSVGGIALRSRTEYKLTDRFSGFLSLDAAYTRTSVDNPFQRSFSVVLNHNQQMRPNESITASVDYKTEGFLSNTSFNVADRIRQNAVTNVSYQRTLYNSHGVSASFVMNQNLVDGSLSQDPVISYVVPQFTPFKTLFPANSWLGDIALSFTTNARYGYALTKTSFSDPGVTRENGVIEHRPSITVTPKLGPLTIAPTVSYSENWNFQQYTESVDPTDSSVVRSRSQGFFRDYTYSAGVNISTFLYGMLKPDILGIKAFRHTVQPTISVRYQPDQSSVEGGSYGRYVSPVSGQTITYARFNNVLASRQEQLALGYSLLNRFAIKMADDDTSEAKPIELLTVDLSGNYNFAADSLGLSPISLGIRAPVLQGMTFTFNTTLTPYASALIADPRTGAIGWGSVNRTLAASGGGLVRATSVNLQLGTTFTSTGVSFAPTTTSDSTAADSAATGDLRNRFSQRFNYRSHEADIFADRMMGYSALAVPWDVTLNLSYNSSRPTPVTSNDRLDLQINGNLSLSETLRMTASTGLNLLNGQFATPIINITKRIHCWNLALQWTPTGFNRGFFLTFSADGALLRDLRLTKQNSPILR
jgi:hypothetical protein